MSTTDSETGLIANLIYYADTTSIFIFFNADKLHANFSAIAVAVSSSSYIKKIESY